MFLKQTFLRLFRGEVPTKTLIKNGMKVGKNFRRMTNVTLDPGHCWLIEIGDNVILAPRVFVLCHDASMKNELGYSKIGRVTIGNDVFVGAQSVILPNVKIGNRVIVGAGSVVSRDVPDGVVVAGNPARIIGTADEFYRKNKDGLKTLPVFGEDYTVRGNITPEKKEAMKKALQNGPGYVK